MQNVRKILWLYLLALSAVTMSCTEEVEPVNIRSDQDFVTYAAHSGIFKAQVSRLATQVAGTEDLKIMGSDIFGYYNAANSELNRLGRENGFTVPVGLDDKFQQLYNELDRLWGQDFDSRYLTEMQKIYQEDIKWFEEASRKLQNTTIKSWAGNRLDELRVQQADLQQIARGRGL
jgi:predicted outer membrane protein